MKHSVDYAAVYSTAFIIVSFLVAFYALGGDRTRAAIGRLFRWVWRLLLLGLALGAVLGMVGGPSTASSGSSGRHGVARERRRQACAKLPPQPARRREAGLRRRRHVARRGHRDEAPDEGLHRRVHPPRRHVVRDVPSSDGARARRELPAPRSPARAPRTPRRPSVVGSARGPRPADRAGTPRAGRAGVGVPAARGESSERVVRERARAIPSPTWTVTRARGRGADAREGGRRRASRHERLGWRAWEGVAPRAAADASRVRPCWSARTLVGGRESVFPKRSAACFARSCGATVPVAWSIRLGLAS